MNSITTKGTKSKQQLELKYSYNPKITPDQSKKKAAKKAWGWKETSVSWDEKSLTNMVQNHSYLPSTLKDGHKVKESVNEVHFLPLDFDEGPTISEFKRQATNWKFSWFLHTTTSHQKEKRTDKGEISEPKDRFRVIIPFSVSISRDEMIEQKDFWVQKFPKIDSSYFEGERYYYQNASAETYLHNNVDESGNVVWLNPHDERLKVERNNINKKSTSTNETAEEVFNLDQEITLANKEIVKVKDIKQKERIFCPFCIHDIHHRNNPESDNAFIDINSSGSYYISCSSESKTYWQEAAEKAGIYRTKKNNYKKVVVKGEKVVETKLTSFIINAKELLVMDDSDTLLCDIVTESGIEYKNILLDNKDWHTKTKLLSAIGHQDCTFLGSEVDVQVLCGMINQKVPVRKTGTKTIGLHNDRWVVNGYNITKDGRDDNPKIVPSEKGSDAFYKKIEYPTITKDETDKLFQRFYENILEINDPKTIIPFISWSFATPLKPLLTKEFDGYPHLFVHGAQGSGKTSTAVMMMKFFGYNSEGTYSCTMKQFPMLKLLSSTNAIPLVFDEFKKSDMRENDIHNMLRLMRKSYNGENESKGRADQTIVDYKLDAPMIVMGEWNIIEPAIRERIIVSSFTNAVKNNVKMQKAFAVVKSLQLESFMLDYIPFVLNQDIEKLRTESENYINNLFSKLNIAPRVKKNISIMYLGFLLFRSYAEENKITIPSIHIDDILDYQLEEITGNKSGEVESSVDQLINGISNMYLSTNHYHSDYHYREYEIKSVKLLAIPLKMILPEFKTWIKKTDYEIGVLDVKSYYKLFKDTEYVVGHNNNIKYPGNYQKQTRSLCIDIDKAIKAGVDLEGFGLNSGTIPRSTNGPFQLTA